MGHRDKPYLSDKNDEVDNKLYGICVSAGVEHVDNAGIAFSGLSGDGLNLNRSRQGKVMA